MDRDVFEAMVYEAINLDGHNYPTLLWFLQGGQHPLLMPVKVAQMVSYMVGR